MGLELSFSLYPGVNQKTQAPVVSGGMLEMNRKEKMMILKNQYARAIFTGAVTASAVVILSLFEPDRFVLPAVLATAILVFCAPYLTFGRTEGMKEERAYQLAAVVAGVAVGLVILGQPTEGRLIPRQRHQQPQPLKEQPARSDPRPGAGRGGAEESRKPPCLPLPQS